MIIDKRENLEKYIPLSAEIAEISAFLEKYKNGLPENGRYDLSERCYANVMEYDTAAADKDFECHAKYADLMTVLSGSERLCFAPDAGLDVTEEYKEDGDYAMLSGKMSGCTVLSPENFALIMPGEAHKSGISAEQNEHIKKIVFKIEVL